MGNKAEARRAEFKAALAFNKETQGEFCERVGVGRQHLHQVLTHERESKRLDGLVDRYIADFRKKFTTRKSAA